MDQKAINSIRSLALDMIDEAKCGYPGVTLDAAPIFYTLYSKHMVFNKINPTWINRDRFVLSAGHASALLYSTLFYCGNTISLEQIKNYTKYSSPLGFNPSLNYQIGVDATTGALGEGLGISVGMAIGEEYLRNILSSDIINHYTYCFVSDGDLMKGISYEAASLAGSLHLGHLIVLYDSNLVLEDSKTKGVFDDDVRARFESMKWDVQVVDNAEDYNQIDKAIRNAKNVNDKPSIIIIKSLAGIGSTLEGTSKVTSKPLELEDLLSVKDKMNTSRVPFHTSKDSYDFVSGNVSTRNINIYNEWLKKCEKITKQDEKIAKVVRELENGLPLINLKNIKINFDKDMKEDMRKTNKNLMSAFFKVSDLFMIGSCDSNNSNNSFLENYDIFTSNDRNGRNILYGVRQEAMGSIMNGLALSGLKPIGSTYLSFSSYLRSSIKSSTLMNNPVTYIFTHDSIRNAQRGEVFNPIDDLTILRSTPNFNVYRPCDVRELVACWDNIINLKKPSALLIPSEDKPLFPYSNVLEASKGGYIIKKENGRLAGIIISTGTDVESAIKVSDNLDLKGVHTRVISIPSLEVFESQGEEYVKSLFQIGIKIIAIESSNDPVWNKYVYNEKYILNLNHYTKSGTNEEIVKHYEFDIDSLTNKVEKLLK